MAFITNDRIDGLLRRGDVDGALREPVKLIAPDRNGVAAFVSGRTGRIEAAEDIAYASLTLGDFLYDYIRIDPEVVRGIAFARAADVDGVLSFARFANAKADLTGASLQGLHSQLQGYVAEQIAAHHLVAQGHDVLFPATANNPGWDFRVDGQPFQVKCLTDPEGVLTHFHRYRDIPVIVNSELGHRVGDHAGVYVDPELHHDAVRHATEETLDRGRALTDFEIPWISLGVSGAFNLYYMVKNDTDLTSMLTCTATDTIGRTAGGGAGKFVGAAAGAFLFGPAGVIVIGLLGAIGGAMAGRRAAGDFRGWWTAEEERAVRDAARRVAQAGAEAMPAKLDAWAQKSELMAQNLSGPKPNQQKMQKAILQRIRIHIEHWKQKKVELEEVACRPSEGAQGFCQRVIVLLRRAGLHANAVRDSMTELGSKLETFARQAKRFRVPAS